LSARNVPEIREAIELFEKWERGFNDPAAAAHFTEALELLAGYLEGEPDSAHRSFIQNLRLTNTRRLLQLLVQVDKRDFGLWLEYAMAVATLVDKEAASVMAAQPALKKDYDAFLGVWKDALFTAVQGAKR
jgi:hypothetical protein